MKAKKLLHNLNKTLAHHNKWESEKWTVTTTADKTKLAYENREYTFPILPLRTYQQKLRNYILNEDGKQAIIIRPRRAGKETESWSIVIEAAIRTPGLYIMMYPTKVQGKLVLWSGNIILKNGYSLPFIKFIPPELIARGPLHDELKIYLKNGSIIWITGCDDNPNRVRGSNARGIVYCEFDFQSPRAYIILRPVFHKNKGWQILQSTLSGYGYMLNLYEKVKESRDWFTAYDTVLTC